MILIIAAPRFYLEGWLDEDTEQGWKLKENAPEWAKKEFEDVMQQLNSEPDKDGRVTLI